MHCGEKYPDEPPTIQFVSQINLPCVNPQNGLVDPKQLPCLAQWKRENTMETILIELRRCVRFPPVSFSFFSSYRPFLFSIRFVCPLLVGHRSVMGVMPCIL